MHDDEPAAVLCGELGDAQGSRQPPHVVEDRRARGHADGGHVVLICVDRNGHTRFAGQPAHDDLGAGDLLLQSHRCVPGTRRFAADVKHVGALANHADALRDRRLDIRAETVAAE